MYKQIIIARKDLKMSPGKLAAQVSHASMAFLTWMIRNNVYKKCNEQRLFSYKYADLWSGRTIPAIYNNEDLNIWAKEAFERKEDYFYIKSTDPSLQNETFIINPEYAYQMEDKFELCESPTFTYISELKFDSDTYENWIDGIFTKCILGAKNKNQLLKAKTMAEELGMVEGEDFFLIKDCCNTELEPEEVDENGIGRCLTCIGFRPMASEVIDKIGKKYQLYK